MKVLLSLIVLLWASTAAAAPEALSLDRLAGGVQASAVQVVQVEGSNTSFVPGAFLSYSLAENLSAAASYSYYEETEAEEGRVGLRLITTGTKPGARLQVAIGGDALWADYLSETAFTASLRASWGVIKDSGERMDLYVALSGEYEPKTEKKWWRLGLVVPIFGGGVK